MKRSWVFVLFFLLPSHNGAMKQMDLESLIVGIKHHDAHFQSALGRLELWKLRFRLQQENESTCC